MAVAAVQDTVVRKSGWKMGILLSMVVALISGAIGFSVPLVFPSLVGVEKPVQETVSENEPSFISFGPVTANLNEGRLTRYLRISITLEIRGSEELQKEFSEAMNTKRSLMVNWLLSYLADMTLDDIRGTAGQNRLRREIHDHFNAVLFPEGQGQIDDVLFEEFTIQ